MTNPNPRKARGSELIDVYCDSPSAVQSAMDGDGRWPVKLSSGHTVVFGLEGDYLAARVTPANAELMKSFSLFEVDGLPRKKDPETAVTSWMDEGRRLYEARQGRSSAQPGSSSILSELSALAGKDRIEGLLTELMGKKVEEATERMAATRVAEQEARAAANSTEFNFRRMSDGLTDGETITLFNEFEPHLDPTAIPQPARVTMLSRSAPTNPALASALRVILGEYHQ